MSHRTCTAPRPAPFAVPRPGAVPHIIRARPVPLVLGCALTLLVWVALRDAHLALAPGLARVIGPSPLPVLNAIQLAKLAILAALALVVLGAVAVALHAPHDRHERRLAQRFVLTLVAGGALSVGLDLVAMLGAVRLPAVEVLVESLTFACCLLLLARHATRGRAPPARRRGTASARSPGTGDAGGYGGVARQPGGVETSRAS